MSPRPATAAGRGGSARDAGHRAGVRPGGPAPRIPRRVSGPAGGAAGAVRLPGGAGGARVAAPAPRPVRVRAAAGAGVAYDPRTAGAPALPWRAARAILTLPDSRWLDRLIRGRLWIPVLAVLLVGIVFMQVENLKLGAAVGRSLAAAGQLQSREEILRADVAALSSPQRIEQIAYRHGLEMPGAADPTFVRAGSGASVAKAISHIAPPNPTAFEQALATEKAQNGDPTTPTTTTTTPTTPSSDTTASSNTATTPDAEASDTAGSSDTTPSGGPASSDANASSGDAASSTATGASATSATDQSTEAGTDAPTDSGTPPSPAPDQGTAAGTASVASGAATAATGAGVAAVTGGSGTGQ